MHWNGKHAFQADGMDACTLCDGVYTHGLLWALGHVQDGSEGAYAHAHDDDHDRRWSLDPGHMLKGRQDAIDDVGPLQLVHDRQLVLLEKRTIEYMNIQGERCAHIRISTYTYDRHLVLLGQHLRG